MISISCTTEPFEPSLQAPLPQDTLIAEEGCFDFDSLLNNCGIEQEFFLEPSYYYPAINPLNPSEFVYYKDKQVFKYDMNTGTSVQLASNIQVISRMDWGRTGWIVFSNQSWKVWKLKDDGSELQQISFNPRDIGPEFNDAGNAIIYLRNMEYSDVELKENPELAYRSQMIICKIDGSSLDSICIIDSNQCKGWDISSWNENDQIAHIDGKSTAIGEPLHYGISSYNVSTNENTTLYFDDVSYLTITDIEWHPNGTDIFFITHYGNNRGTIYKVSTTGGEPTLIKEGCDNRFYEDMSISPDGDFMLVQKGTAYVEGCDTYTKRSIVKMDLYGNNEQLINLK
ncbi:MAG: hypothetical protein R2813_11245 [Flavobacteriales bacterium]